jgi:hypothetical protein
MSEALFLYCLLLIPFGRRVGFYWGSSVDETRRGE